MTSSIVEASPLRRRMIEDMTHATDMRLGAFEFEMEARPRL
jgi:hypothetical protein